METIRDRLHVKLESFKDDLVSFLSAHTRINARRHVDGVFTVGPANTFYPLKSEAKPSQHALHTEFKRLTEIVRTLLADAVAPQKQKFEKAVEQLRLLIEQDKHTSYPDMQTAIHFVRRSIEDIQSVFKSIYKETSLLPMLIPDTNALYENTDIEGWAYDEFGEFQLIITPSVFKDLDRHKIEHRNEIVREKANKLIRRFKEYRNRGQLTAGVPVVTGKISLLAIAKEANVAAALGWLDPSNDDDKLIAEAIEIIRSHANHPVYIITGDINLQNKCELASIPFLEAPGK